MSIAVSSPVRLRLSIVSRGEELCALADDWNRLAGPVPFRRWEWLEAAWRHYHAPTEELRVVCAWDESDRLVGVLPLSLRRRALQGRVLRLIGSLELCSEYLTVLTTDEHRESVARLMVEELVSGAAGAWDVIELDTVDPADPGVQQLCEQFSAAGSTVDRQVVARAWRASLPESWDAYLSMLSKSRRERVRRLIRRVFDTGRAIRHEVTDVHQLDEGFGILYHLHQLRWTSVGEDGTFATARARAFHREVMDRFLRIGRLQLAWIEAEGEPLAVEYCLRGDDAVYYYQGGIDPERGDEDPGWLQFIGSLRSAIENGYRTYDFLRGDEPYKASWRATPIPLERVRIVGRSKCAALRHDIWKSGRALKQWLKGSF